MFAWNSYRIVPEQFLILSPVWHSNLLGHYRVPGKPKFVDYLLALTMRNILFQRIPPYSLSMLSQISRGFPIT